jgi:hypothetical protein
MIGVPTALIVGAGASKPYGLPSGSDLLRLAGELSRRDELYGILNTVSPNYRGGATDLDNCLDDLKKYRGPSIDAFLENQPKHRELGHQLIAGLMGHAVLGLASKRGVAAKEDWMGYVIERMREGASTFDDFLQGNRSLFFITFNFDSLIENRLREEAQGIYNVGNDSEIAQRIRVVHVHGRIPGPEGAFSPGWVRAAANDIKVIHDELEPDVITEARNIIKRARIICFLGFHYRKENLETLGLLENQHEHGAPLWFGSAFGHEDGEQGRVRRLFNEKTIILGHKEGNCLDMLRRHDILREG